MTPRRTIVFFPCHSLDDFPTWLGDSEADELLAAWTAAWDPRLVAASGRIPAWASVEAPPGNDVEVLGIVTAHCDDRLAGLVDPASTPGSRWVRRAGSREETLRQALAAVGQADVEPPLLPAADPPARPVTPADFHAFGLAWLLSELLARRMRSSTGLGSSGPFSGSPADAVTTGFEERLVDAARAWVAGDGAAAAAGLTECYGHLEAARARYYSVDVWLLDVVLLAETTLGARLAAELGSPVPWALVATGSLIEKLARTDTALTARLREACDAGRIAPAGGRWGEEPLDGCLPETIRESFLQGHDAWRKATGRVPATFAQVSGGWSPALPAILSRFDYAGVIWNLFDGTPLPDPGTGRIRWEGSGNACLDGIARTPLDARRASTILTLADRIGEAIDHDHTAVVWFAHHAGLSSPFFGDLRRIGSWSTALGTFVTPDELFRRTAGAGTLVSWEPDSYPVSRPAEADAALADPVAPRLEATRAEAARIVAGRKVLAGLRRGPGPAHGGDPSPAKPAAPRAARGGGLFGGLARGLFGGGDENLVIEHDLLRVRIHPVTGGILSLRRPGERGNRLSQHVALRTTRPPPPPGSPWEDALERADYAPAVASSCTRTGTGSVESRGRIVDGAGKPLGDVVQRVSLVPGMPLARIEIEVALSRAPGSLAAKGQGNPLEHALACRWAWNENDDLDLRRSLHGQGIATERTLLTAPHFLALRQGRGGETPDVSILTGGLPWHLRSTPHTLDSWLLAGDGTKGTFTLAVGIGLKRPWEAALDLAATGTLAAPGQGAGAPSAGPLTASDHVRIGWAGPVLESGKTIGVRVLLVESEGRAGDVTVDWGFDVARARFADALGRPLPGDVTLAGRSTTVWLARYGQAWIDLLFPGNERTGE